ncbi:hypothetical protein DXG03_007436 [Asterophora parasitica]|uniref:Pheromone receptor n=1 Tax=Asterophora parasitica TaxID=117018 RepID=A0A9P7G0P8_9AGAR|nr:hypothetical protein DXG03_007436 [Asterophora parasitica]
MSIPNEVITALSFIGFVMCCIPFPWHFEAWNTGTCLYMAWTGLACLTQFINSIVWNKNAINWAPVWCDITARIIIGVSVAIPAASLCINRRLYHIASVRSVTVTKAEKRRAIMVDLAIGLGLPILTMVLQYIPQGHRFDIFEDVGCFPYTYMTPVGIALVNMPPVLIGTVSAVYSVLSIRAFLKSHRQFQEFLSSSNNLSKNRYIRLILMAGVETSLTVPLGVWTIYSNAVTREIAPWKGWADTHLEFSRVDQIPAILWRSDKGTERGLEMTRILVIFAAFVFFGFFGFAEEARKNYRSAAQTMAKRVGLSTASSSFTLWSSTGSKSKGVASSKGTTSSTGPAALPMHVERKTIRKHDSLDSFSDMSASFADVGGILDEKNEKDDKSLNLPRISYDGLRLQDVGGTLADFNDGPYSPTPSSGASSASSISELSPTAPEAAVTRPDSVCIEISSVRHLQIGEFSDALSIPEPAVPRHISDSSPV